MRWWICPERLFLSSSIEILSFNSSCRELFIKVGYKFNEQSHARSKEADDGRANIEVHQDVSLDQSSIPVHQNSPIYWDFSPVRQDFSLDRGSIWVYQDSSIHQDFSPVHEDFSLDRDCTSVHQKLTNISTLLANTWRLLAAHGYFIAYISNQTLFYLAT